MGKRDMVFRGHIYMADLSGGVIGSEQGGIRPVLIIQNDTGNRYSPTTIVIPLTSQTKSPMPTHCVFKKSGNSFLTYDSVSLAEQIKTIDKSRIREFLGVADDKIMETVNKNLRISLAL